MPTFRLVVVMTLSLLGIALLSVLLAGLWQQAAVRDLARQAQLDRAQSSLRLVEQQQREMLLQRADLVASNQAFVSYVSLALDPSPLPGMGADVGSLTDILIERRDQSGLEHLAVIGLDGRVVAATDTSLLRRRDLSSEPLVRQSLQGLKPASGAFLEAGVLSFIVIKPLLAGSTAEGFLLAAIRLDNEYARELSRAVGLDVLLLAETGDGLTPLSSSLDPQRATSIAKLIGARGAGKADAGQSSDSAIPEAMAPGGQASTAHRLPLFEGDNSALQIAFLLPDRSSNYERAVWQPLLLPLALLTLLGILTAGMLWRRLLRPMELLPELLTTAAAGDVHRVMPMDGGTSARSIARGFNQLMATLQQRSASSGAQRDERSDVPGRANQA